MTGINTRNQLGPQLSFTTDINTRLILSKVLPFYNCSPFSISQLTQSRKNRFLEKLESNNFSKNMTKLVNGFSKNNYTCNFFMEESVNNLAKKHKADCLKVFHYNIESFNTNGDKLSSYLKCLNFEYDIICLTEVRTPNPAIISLEFPNYDVYLDCVSTKKGGVAILLKKDKFKDIYELDINQNFNINNQCCTNCKTENRWLSFKIDKLNVIVGGVYRHPKSNINHFNVALNELISQIKDDTLAIVFGDVNINLLSENNEKVNTYLNNYLTNNFIPCITLPTRITDHSISLIDHIFVKTPKKLIQNKCSSGNLILDISDHLPNFSFIDIKTPSIKDRPFIRLFTEKRIELFLNNLDSENALIEDSDLTDIDSSYSIFSTNYFNLFNRYFPYIKQSRKSFKDKPFITKGIKVSIKYKNKLFKKYRDNPTDANEAAWKRFRNKTNSLIKTVQENYYKKLINSNNNSSKQFWKTFGNILNKNKKHHKRIVNLNIDNTIINDNQKITESFNDFFCQIGTNLASKFSNNDNEQFRNYLKDPANQSLLLYKINQI